VTCGIAALVLALLAVSAGPAGAAGETSADRAFVDALDAGLRAFYARDFTHAEERFAAALERVPDDAFASAFRATAAAHQPGRLDAVIAAGEDRAAAAHSYAAHVQLGFAYLVAGERDADAREEFGAALALDPKRAPAHDGLGVLRENARTANRAKLEFQAALAADPGDVLAREELALLYQVDLKEPQRALTYAIDIPNRLPDYADIDFHIASLLDDLHQPAAAIDYATRGLALDVGHVGEAGRHGFTLLARIYLERKQIADAKRVLHASILADVDTAYARALLRRIDAGDGGK
jgi:Tfp pilus assembly protein PilF